MNVRPATAHSAPLPGLRDRVAAGVAALRRDHGPRATFVLPGGHNAVPRHARRIVCDVLDGWAVPADTRDDAEAIMSELVNNTVLHTLSRRIELRLRLHDRQLTVGVVDQGRGWLRLGDQAGEHGNGEQAGADVDVLAESGRGLFMVDRLTRQQWGALSCRGGTLVWARLTLSAPAVPTGR